MQLRKCGQNSVFLVKTFLETEPALADTDPKLQIRPADVRNPDR